MKGETEGLMRFWLMMAMVLGLLAGCQDKAPKAPDDGLANYDFHAFDQQKAKCEARTVNSGDASSQILGTG